MKVFYSPYELIPDAGTVLNSRGATENKGSLLKVEFPNGTIGYSDLRPHPELGDQDLKFHLKSLDQQQPTIQAKKSLFFAEIDAKARASNESLFKNLKLPQTHYAAGSLANFRIEQTQTITESGYTHIKFKTGIDLVKERYNLSELLKQCESLSVRLDFNESLSSTQFINWLEAFKPDELCRIDFIEDPFRFEQEAWSKIKNVSLGIDRQVSPKVVKDKPWLIPVIKPAINDLSVFFKEPAKQRIIFTNYMDHPLGEMAAIFESAKYYQETHTTIQTCGLRTSHLFKSSAYSELILGSGPELKTAEGFGLGFDQLLEQEPWQIL